MGDTDRENAIWDSYWRSGDYEYGAHPILVERVLKHVPSRNANVVEIGAGSGVDAVEIAKSGFRVIALDKSRESIRVIRRKTEKYPIDICFVVADALNLPFKNHSIDLIYHQGVMEHFRNPLPFLAQQKLALKGGGRLLVDVPQTYTLYTLRKKWAMARKRWFAGWETQYSPGKLRKVIGRAGMRVVDFYGRDYDLLPFVWLRDIRTLGQRRFGRPIIPKVLSEPLAKIWSCFERTAVSNYIKHSVGAVAAVDEDSD